MPYGITKSLFFTANIFQFEKLKFVAAKFLVQKSDLSSQHNDLNRKKLLLFWRKQTNYAPLQLIIK